MMRLINSILAAITAISVSACYDGRGKETTFPDGTVYSFTSNGREQTQTLTFPDGTSHTRATIDVGSQPTDCEWETTLLVFKTKKCKGVTPPRMMTREFKIKDGKILEQTVSIESNPEIERFLSSFGCKVCATTMKQ